MWHSRPPRDPPPLHGKYHLKFPFWLLAHLPNVNFFFSLSQSCFSKNNIWLGKIPLGGARYPFPNKFPFLSATGAVVCQTSWQNKAGCNGVLLDVDSLRGPGPETVTWGDAANDPYMYKIWVNDYDDLGVGQSGAKITLFGETNIKMEAEAGKSGRQALQIFVKTPNCKKETNLSLHCFLH